MGAPKKGFRLTNLKIPQNTPKRVGVIEADDLNFEIWLEKEPGEIALKAMLTQSLTSVHLLLTLQELLSCMK